MYLVHHAQMNVRFCPTDARAVAAFVIDQVITGGQFSKIALSHALEKSCLSGVDKGFCTELVYGTLRFYKPLEHSLQRAQNNQKKAVDRRIKPHLMVAAYQLQHLSETVPAFAAVDCAVKQIRKLHPALGNFANALLRNLGSAQHLLLKPTEHAPAILADAYGFEPFVMEAIQELLPEETLQEALLAMNGRPRLYGRVYGDEKPRANLLPHAFVPGAFYFQKPGLVLEQEAFLKGEWIVQDPASQIAALLLGAKPGEHVLDLCAAPGGKALVISEAVGAKGRVIACDVHPGKAKQIKENADRMGMDLEIQIADGRDLPNLFEKMDRVLLDAPCSSLGTTRRHPEVKRRVLEKDMQDIIELQAELLQSASNYVKQNGFLVYSVCSPLPKEGYMQIEQFLEKNPCWKRVDAKEILSFLPNTALNAKGEVQLWPHLHDCDAFFAACLKKG